MTHAEKVDAFARELEQRGFWLSNAIPPFTRLLWKLGYEVPPPYFLLFRTAVLHAGAAFGLVFGGGAGAVLYIADEMPLFVWPLSVVISGAFFGLGMACFWAFQRRRLGLPRWSEYHGAAQQGGATVTRSAM